MTGFRSDSGTLSYFSRKFCRCFSLIDFEKIRYSVRRTRKKKGASYHEKKIY